MKQSDKAAMAAAASQGGESEKSPTSAPAPIPRVAPPIPQVPLVAQSINPEVQVVHRNMLDAMMIVDEPARASFSSVASRVWGELSMEIGLGTSRPPRAHAGMDATRKFFYLAPTTKEDPMGIEVKYKKGRAEINLVKAFAPLSRYVQPGRREYYDLGITPAKVRFDDGFESVSLYVYLSPTKTEPVRTMSEEAKAKAKATRARKKQQGGQATGTEK